MPNIFEFLGRLAASCELRAEAGDLSHLEREHVLARARTYRNLQIDILQARLDGEPIALPESIKKELDEWQNSPTSR